MFRPGRQSRSICRSAAPRLAPARPPRRPRCTATRPRARQAQGPAGHSRRPCLCDRHRHHRVFSTTEQPIQAFLQLSEGLVEIRRPLAVAIIAALTTPRILIIRVATRLIPSHSALHLIKQRRTHARRPMLQNACYCGTTAFSGFYCKVCCSMNSVGTTPSRLTSRFSSERGNRTASKLTPSSSCSSFCTAPSSKNCARSRAKR